MLRSEFPCSSPDETDRLHLPLSLFYDEGKSSSRSQREAGTRGAVEDRSGTFFSLAGSGSGFHLLQSPLLALVRSQLRAQAADRSICDSRVAAALANVLSFRPRRLFADRGSAPTSSILSRISSLLFYLIISTPYPQRSLRKGLKTFLSFFLWKQGKGRPQGEVTSQGCMSGRTHSSICELYKSTQFCRPSETHWPVY